MNLYLEEQVLQIIANLNREHFVTPEELLEEMGYTPIVLSSGESLKDKLFTLANEFAVAGYGKTAVILHTIHNGLGNNEQEVGNNEQQ